MKYKDTVVRNSHYHCLEYDHDQAGDICLIASGMEKCDPGENCGPYVRDGYHLHVILSGKGVLHINGKTIYPHGGQMFLLKHNEECRYIADMEDPWDYCWVTYNGAYAKNISEKIGFHEGIYCLNTDIPATEFYNLINRMHQHPEMDDINELRRRGILMEFLALAMDATKAYHSLPRRSYNHPAELYVQRAVDAIHNNYGTISVNDVIKHIGFSRSYFSTVFQKHIGCSMQEYLVHYRLKKSCELLAGTDLKVQEIAEKVGYENQMTFARIFKKVYGLSPTEYREENTSGILEKQIEEGQK